jgi:hypothetical protein
MGLRVVVSKMTLVPKVYACLVRGMTFLQAKDTAER